MSYNIQRLCVRASRELHTHLVSSLDFDTKVFDDIDSKFDWIDFYSKPFNS